MAKGSSRRIEDIMNNSADRSQLNTHIDEYVRCLTRVADEKESMKGIVDAIKEKIDIDPGLFKTLAKISFKNDAVEKLAAAERLETAIEMMFTIHGEDGDEDRHAPTPCDHDPARAFTLCPAQHNIRHDTVAEQHEDRRADHFA